jgi:hypothetical protein
MILFDGTTGDSIQVVAAGGGTPGPATKIVRERGETMHGWPFFLPDGEHFVYIAFRRDEPPEIRLGELGTFESKRLTEGDSRVEYVAPGFLVFERGGTLLAQPFDADRGELAGDPFPLAEGIGTGNVGLAHFSGSANGTLIYTSGDRPERQLGWFDREGHEQQVFATPKRYGPFALSPDGNRVVVEVMDETGSSADLWTMDLRRGVESRFTFASGDERGPVWSADGTQIYYTGSMENGLALMKKNAYGTGNPETVLELEGFASAQSVTADGAALIMQQSTSNRGWDVVSFPLDGDTLVTQVSAQSHQVHGAVSPNGEYLAYVSYESGRFEVYVTSFPAGSGRWQVSLAGGTEPLWRGDNKELFFVSLDRRLMAVDVNMGPPIEFGIPHKLFDAPMPRNYNTRNRYAVSADGKRFLMLVLLDRGRVPPTTVILNWATELAER